MDWYIEVLANYVNFSGRARRKEYWMFTLINGIIISITYIPGRILAANHETTGTALVFLIICLLYELAVLLPSIAVVVRRLHDQDKSGAWYFINFLPFIGGIWLLILMCMEGTRGPNQYGEDPKQQWTEPSLHRAPAVSGRAPPEPKSPFRITGVTLSKQQADKGEEIGARITYQNNGDEIKDYLLTLYVNDAEVYTKRLDIPSRTQGSVDMKLPPMLEDGVYTVRTGNCSQKLMIGQINIIPDGSAHAYARPIPTAASAPARPESISLFRITGLTLSKTQADKGEEISARITYQNNGVEMIDYPMTLIVNDAEVRKQYFNIPSNTQGSVDIKVPPIWEDGVYTVGVGNCSQKLMIGQVNIISDAPAPAHTEPKPIAAPALSQPGPKPIAVPAPAQIKPRSAAASAPQRTGPKSFRITGVTLSKLQADRGEGIEARITYQNNGDEIKDHPMTLYANGVEVNTRQFDIPSHTQGSVAMQVPPVWDDGVYTVRAGDCSQNLMIGAVDLAQAASAFARARPKSAAVPAPKQPETKSSFRITSVKLSKLQADRGEAIEARIMYQNNGDEIKEYPTTLYVNDVEVHTQHSDIPSYTQGSVAIQVPPLWESGEYTVRAGNCSQKLVIE